MDEVEPFGLTRTRLYTPLRSNSRKQTMGKIMAVHLDSSQAAIVQEHDDMEVGTGAVSLLALVA